jgi:hypothetical protein
MTSITAKARLAGTLCVLMGIPAWFSLMYIPSAFIVRGDASATARNRVTLALGGLGELAMVLWMIVMGAKVQPFEARVS